MAFTADTAHTVLDVLTVNSVRVLYTASIVKQAQRKNSYVHSHKHSEVVSTMLAKLKAI